MLWLDSARMFSFAEVTPYLVANPPPPTPPGAELLSLPSSSTIATNGALG